MKSFQNTIVAIIIANLFVTLSASAQDDSAARVATDSDSVVSCQDEKLVIADSVSTIVANDSVDNIGWDFSILSYSTTRKKNKNRRMFEVKLGLMIEAGWLCALGSPEEAKYKVRSSKELSIEMWKFCYYSPHKRNTFSIGFGWDKKRYGSKIYTGYENGTVEYAPYPEGITHPNTTMYFNYFVFPLTYIHKFTRSQQQLGLSVIPSLLGASKIHNNYKTTDGKAGELFDVDARQFALDLRMAWYPIDHIYLYLKYSPLAPLAKPNPQFNAFSFGFGISF